MQDRLRRTLTESSSALIGGLVWLRGAGIFILVVTVALAVALVVFVNQRFMQYDLTLHGCDIAIDVVASALISTQHVRLLTIAARGWYPLSASEEAARRAIIMDAATSMLASHREVYAVAQAAGLQASYERRNVPMLVYSSNLATNSLDVTPTPVSLYEGGLLLASAIQDVAAMPLANISRGTPIVEFVINNAFAGTPIYEAFNTTLLGWMHDSLAMYNSVLDTTLAMYGAMVAVVFIIGALVVQPILIHVDRVRDQYLLPFVALPPVVPAKLRANAERRLRLLRATEADDEDGSDDSTVEAQMEEGDDETTGNGETDWDALLHGEAARSRARRRGMGTAGGGSGSVSGTYGSGTYGPAGSGSGAGGGAGGAGTAWTAADGSKRRYRKSSRSLLVAGVQYMFPLLLVFTFITVAYIVTKDALEKAHVLQQFDLVSHFRMLEAIETPMLTRGTLSVPGAYADMIPQVSVATRMADALEYHNRLLMYAGEPVATVFEDVSAHNDALPGLLPAADMDTINRYLFGDACAEMATAGIISDVNACYAFRGGVLRRGVSAGTINLLALCRGIIARRRAAIVPLNTTTGAGVMMVGNNSVYYSLAAEVQSADMEDAFMYGNKYLHDSYIAMVDLITDTKTAALTNNMTFLQVFVGLFIAFFTLYQVFVFLPQVRRSNAAIKTERVVMLLLPARLLQSTPQLQELVAKMLEVSAAESGATATTSAS